MKMKMTRYLTCALTLVIINVQTLPVFAADQRLFGWADLHAHPATHLAFGSDANGEKGIFWGKPGGKWTPLYSTTNQDLPSCSYAHGDFDGDIVRHETHKTLMQTLDAVTEYPHITSDWAANNNGATSYGEWPYARSISHQQMHITALRRAYDGGQRMMIASVTDNEFLSDMWTKIGFNVFGNSVPKIDPNFGFNSAVKQIKYIKGMAAQNSDWMQIAYSAAEARSIVAADKLALVLSLEIDSLTEVQVLQLVDSYGVRHVIPVHLIDNDFGGTAVYSDAFNVVNNFVHSTRTDDNLDNNGFLKVGYDANLKFRLLRPQYPHSDAAGSVKVDPVPIQIYAGLGYISNLQAGHRNLRGLSARGIDLLTLLAKRGVMIDVAHMSFESTADALAKATQWGYPMMNSHTNFREQDNTANSERDLHRDHLKKIADLGGVIGLGTEWYGGLTQMVDLHNLANKLKAQTPSMVVPLKLLPGDPEISQFQLRIKTGADGLNTDLYAVIVIDGAEHKFLLNKSHENWRANLVTTPTIQLPKPIKSSKLTQLTLRIDSGDSWDITEIKINAIVRGDDPVKTWLTRFTEGLYIMGGKGMMIGTDMNGFAPQLYLPADDATYPVMIASQFGPSNHTPALQRFSMGSKSYDFKADGLAHYGMLADFMQALSQQPGAGPAMDRMFHSVNDVVTMWEKCQKVAPGI